MNNLEKKLQTNKKPNKSNSLPLFVQVTQLIQGAHGPRKLVWRWDVVRRRSKKSAALFTGENNVHGPNIEIEVTKVKA